MKMLSRYRPLPSMLMRTPRVSSAPLSIARSFHTAEQAGLHPPPRCPSHWHYFARTATPCLPAASSSRHGSGWRAPEPARQLGYRAFLPHRRQRHLRLELSAVLLPSIGHVSPPANRPLQGETLSKFSVGGRPTRRCTRCRRTSSPSCGSSSRTSRKPRLLGGLPTEQPPARASRMKSGHVRPVTALDDANPAIDRSSRRPRRAHRARCARSRCRSIPRHCRRHRGGRSRSRRKCRRLRRLFDHLRTARLPIIDRQRPLTRIADDQMPSGSARR